MSSLSEFSEQFSRRFRWDQLPIYACLTGIVIWLGGLTFFVLELQGVPPAEMEGLANGILLLTVVIAATPFIGPAMAIGVERLR